ncbi:hypothetical protein KIN20_036686 [Parelaphostrongylus tenuis]|uniref:Uncharacterized protein n=1 Tax=Parelaphostrongylus tenuis TaxID=148309 RepID=A0AAD5WLH1_PARTN|nr:hypothetical protein KIN20_036686 [Parelaphostrongylus tenuis]
MPLSKKLSTPEILFLEKLRWIWHVERVSRNHLKCAPWEFTVHGKQYEGENRQKKESSMGSNQASQRSHRPTNGPKLRAHPFDSTILPALCYAAETWADTSTTTRLLRITHRALEQYLLKLVGTHNIRPACVAQKFGVYSIFMT